MDALPLRAGSHLLHKDLGSHALRAMRRSDAPASGHHLRHQLRGMLGTQRLELRDVAEVLDRNAQDVLLVPKKDLNYTPLGSVEALDV